MICRGRVLVLWAPNTTPRERTPQMITPKFPSPVDLNVRSLVDCSSGYEAGMLTSLLGEAHSRGDVTFSVCRRVHLRLLVYPAILLHQFPAWVDWECLRPDSSTWII